MSLNSLQLAIESALNLGEPNSPGNDIYIAVMGVTGAGKSTLIAKLTNLDVKIGTTLESCTSDVDDFTCSIAGQRVHMIDTPGFDDTNRSDREVLEDIVRWLGTSYQEGVRLHAILYLHRITDRRIGNVGVRNLSMFKKLCGDDFYLRVFLVTTMWEEIPVQLGNEREQQMVTTGKFWGMMVENGASTLRHNNTHKSAREILNRVLRKPLDNAPEVLRVQEELIDQHLSLNETAAGQTFEADLIRQREEHQREMKRMQQEIQDLVAMQEQKAAKDAEIMRKDLEARIQESYADQQKLQSSLEDLQRESAEKARAMAERFEEAQKLYNEKIDEIGRKEKQLTTYDPNSLEAQRLSEYLRRERQQLPQFAQQLREQQGKLEQAAKRLFAKASVWMRQNPQAMSAIATYGFRLVSEVVRQRRANQTRNVESGPHLHESMYRGGQSGHEFHHANTDPRVQGLNSEFGDYDDAELDALYRQSFYSKQQ